MVISALTSSVCASPVWLARRTTRRPAFDKVPGGTSQVNTGAGSIGVLPGLCGFFRLHGFNMGNDAMQPEPGAGEA